MIKKITLLLITSFLFSFIGYSQNSQKIEVNFSGDYGDQYLKLAHYLGEKQFVPVDSVQQKDGLFIFESKENKPFEGGIYLLVFSPSKFYEIIISGTEDNIKVSADTENFMKTVKFENSKENEVFYSFRGFIYNINKKAENLTKMGSMPAPLKTAELNKISKEAKSFTNELIEKNPELFAVKTIKANQEIEIPQEVREKGKTDSLAAFRYYKSNFLETIDFSDKRFIKTPILEKKLNTYFEKLVYLEKDSVIKDVDYVLGLSKQDQDMYRYVLWNISNRYENTTIIGLDGVFVHLIENYYLKDAVWLKEEQIVKFKERLATLKPLQFGKLFPSLVLSASNGEKVDVKSGLSDYTLVYFYSPDCGHCKTAAPDLVKFQETHIGKVDVFNINAKHNEDQAKCLEEMNSFIKEFKTENLINLWDANRGHDFRLEFDVFTTPTSYLLNKNKEIIAKKVSLDEIDRYIEFYEKKNNLNN